MKVNQHNLNGIYRLILCILLIVLGIIALAIVGHYDYQTEQLESHAPAQTPYQVEGN